VLEIDERVLGPETLLELLTGDNQAGVFQKDGEDLEGAILELKSDAGFAQLAREQVRFVGTEADDGGELRRGGHEKSPAGKDGTVAQKV